MKTLIYEKIYIREYKKIKKSLENVLENIFKIQYNFWDRKDHKKKVNNFKMS